VKSNRLLDRGRAEGAGSETDKTKSIHIAAMYGVISKEIWFLEFYNRQGAMVEKRKHLLAQPYEKLMAVIIHPGPEGEREYPVTIIGETKKSFRMIAIKEMTFPATVKPGEIFLAPKTIVRIVASTTEDSTKPNSTVIWSPKDAEYLYQPPIALQSKWLMRVKQWHARMSAEYVETDRSLYNILYGWLEASMVAKAEMTAYGLDPPVMWHYRGRLRPDFYRDILDHGRVIRRKSDRSFVILGEPFGIIETVDQSQYLKAWRTLGARVTLSTESGWMPGRTVTVMIESPLRK
jgi:hypothetical protein